MNKAPPDRPTVRLSGVRAPDRPFARAVTVLLLLALCATPASAQQLDSTNAYHDERVRELVRLARERRTFIDRSINSYDATVKERISVGVRLRAIERLAYRRETATRVEWRRGGPIHVTALGAREVAPMVQPEPWVPGDLDFMPGLAFDPMSADELVRLDDTALRHPLALGGEFNYRYQIGTTTTIHLSGKTITLVELRVQPRRSDVRLLSGSFYIDEETHSVVQVVFRLARDFEPELFKGGDEINLTTRELAQEADSSGRPRRPRRRIPLPGFVKPLRAQLQYVTIEYGLMELRWWLPRMWAAQAVLQAGGIRTSLNYERTYSYHRVEGDTSAALIVRSPVDSATTMPGFGNPCRAHSEYGIPVNITGDSAWAARYRAQMEARHGRLREATDSAIARGDTARARWLREAERCRGLYRITIPDSASLVASTQLPASIYGNKEELTGAAELRKLAERIKSLPVAPWQLRAPKFSWGLGGNGLLRYNKVEGLSLGARTELDLGRLRTDLTAHFGFADLQPKAQLGIARHTPESQARFGVYRQLNVMDQPTGLGGIGASLKAALFGEDDRDYYRTTGIELNRRPPESESQWYDLRLFAEEQRALSNQARFSIAHALDERDTFEANLSAARADQAGAGLTLRAASGQNPEGFRVGAELSVLGSGGTFDFTRESLELRVGFPLPFRLVAALEGSAGTSTGLVPLQSLWFLGGSQSVRGYDAGTVSGNAFWRGRAEIGTAFPAARLVGFTDLGWAGNRDHIGRRASLLSVGVGGSFFDGVVRVDLARALRGNTAWRLHLSLDGIL